MHMADALLSPAVGGVMCAVSAGAVAVAAAKTSSVRPNAHRAVFDFCRR